MKPFLSAIHSLTFQGLSFQDDQRSALAEIAPAEWSALLHQMDRSQITLPLGVRCREFLPQAIVARIDENLKDNAQRHERLFQEYCGVAEKLQECSIPFIMLKGFSHCAPSYVNDIRHRPQSDIDLYAPSAFLDRARDALLNLGFTPAVAANSRTDHLPAMIRDRNWSWRGNYYAPDLPLTVEIHFRLWDPESERIDAGYVEGFWERRCDLEFRGRKIPVLSPADRISYAALHLMRHVLRGDPRLYHVYELAHFLQNTREDDELWHQWRSNHSSDGMILEATAFRLASEWFGCAFHPLVEDAVKMLPLGVTRWFELFASSPFPSGRPNKDELFLHLSLLEKAGDRYSVLARRLFPALPPTPVHPQGEQAILRSNVHFVAQRAFHHARTLFPLARSFFRWKFAREMP